jgi:hypothetical protein
VTEVEQLDVFTEEGKERERKGKGRKKGRKKKEKRKKVFQLFKKNLTT